MPAHTDTMEALQTTSAASEIGRQAMGAGIGAALGAAASTVMGRKWTGGAQTGAVVGLMITLAASSAMNIKCAGDLDAAAVDAGLKDEVQA